MSFLTVYKKLCGIKLLILYVLMTVVVAIPGRVYASVAHNVDAPAEYNYRFTLNGHLYLGMYQSIGASDIDGNGKNDIVIGASYENSVPGRTSNGTVYVILDSILDRYTGLANNIELSDPNNYNLKITGSSNTEDLSDGGIYLEDMNNDGNTDLIIATDGTSPSFYIIPSSILNRDLTPGTILDLLDPNNFYLRVRGINQEGIAVGDLNQDGKKDIATASWETSTTYIFFNTLLNSFSNLGNTIYVSNPGTYNIKVRSDPGLRLGNSMSVFIQDFNQDGYGDFAIGSPREDFNTRADSGSIFVVGSEKLKLYSGTDNLLNLATIGNLSLRIDGAYAGQNMGVRMHSVGIGDLNNNSKNEVVFGDYISNFRSLTNSGSVYVLYDNIITTYWNSGNPIDLNTNFSLRFDGDIASGVLGAGDNLILDYDKDGNNELIFKESRGTYNGITSSGKIYILPNSYINTLSLGSIIYLNGFSDYRLLYYGTTGSSIGYYLNSFSSDVDKNGSIDILTSAVATANAGIYLIYNFPHTISVDSIPSYSATSSPVITGTVTAPNSVTAISGVQYQIDDNAVQGTWVACTASDGAFDSLDEDYTCNLSGLTEDDPYTVYIRAYDTNTSYTAQASYAHTSSFTVDTGAPADSGFRIGTSKGVNNSKLQDVGEHTITYDKKEVKLYLSAKDSISDVAYMMVSQDKNFKNATWKIYDGDVKISFGKDGKKNIYFKFKDSAGNISDTYKQTLTIDTTPPTLTIDQKTPYVSGTSEEKAFISM